tara:strand:+ start:1172 stop:1450 length:279 start_codon:yes stop_codon:yes gene_type:complete
MLAWCLLRGYLTPTALPIIRAITLSATLFIALFYRFFVNFNRFVDSRGDFSWPLSISGAKNWTNYVFSVMVSNRPFALVIEQDFIRKLLWLK